MGSADTILIWGSRFGVSRPSRLDVTRVGTSGYKINHVEPERVQLECVFFGPFRDVTGEKTVIHETDAETVGELLVELERAYPALEGDLVDEDGAELAGKTVVTKNKRNVTHIDGLETALESTDVIRLVPSVYGG